MAKNHGKKRARVTEYLLLGFTLICIGIILVEILRNFLALGI